MANIATASCSRARRAASTASFSPGFYRALNSQTSAIDNCSSSNVTGRPKANSPGRSCWSFWFRIATWMLLSGKADSSEKTQSTFYQEHTSLFSGHETLAVSAPMMNLNFPCQIQCSRLGLELLLLYIRRKMSILYCGRTTQRRRHPGLVKRMLPLLPLGQWWFFHWFLIILCILL